MSANPDRLTDAFSLLASDAAANMPPNSDLEKRLMTEATPHRRKPPARVIAAGIACLMAAITATTVVTAGGIDAVREWFATVALVNPDGTTEHFEATPEHPVILEDYRGVLNVIGDEPGEQIRIFTGPGITGGGEATPNGFRICNGDDELLLVPMPIEDEVADK